MLTILVIKGTPSPFATGIATGRCEGVGAAAITVLKKEEMNYVWSVQATLGLALSIMRALVARDLRQRQAACCRDGAY